MAPPVRTSPRLPPPDNINIDELLADNRDRVHNVEEDNEFEHPPRRAPSEALAAEVVELGMKLEEELSVVEKKIQGIVHSAEKDMAVLRKMGNSRKFMKKVVLDQRFERPE